MPFFDPTLPADLNLLNAGVRTNPELANVSARIEWEVINAFKERRFAGVQTYDAFFQYESGVDPGNRVLVRLVGYNQETPMDSDEALKDILRRTIADMITWCLQSYANAPGVKSKSQGNRSVTFGVIIPTWTEFPSGWDSKLFNYDARFDRYAI